MKFILIFFLTSLLTAQLKAEPFDYNGFGVAGGYPAAVVYFDGQPDDQKALVVACAHCNNLPPASIKLVGADAKEFEIGVEKIFFEKDGRGEDFQELLLYQLKESYADLEEKYGIKKRRINNLEPTIGTPINFVSSHQNEMQTCEISDYQESYLFPETFGRLESKQAIIYYDCLSIPGRSGSIIVGPENNTVYAANSGGSFPYEDSNGKIHSLGTSLHGLYDCIDSDYNLDLEQPSCSFSDDPTDDNLFAEPVIQFASSPLHTVLDSNSSSK